MSKKKSKSKRIFFVMFLILLAVMGYYIYKLYNENLLAKDKEEELNEKISSLEEKIDEIKESKDDDVSIDLNKNNTNNVDSTDVQENEESKEDIIGKWNTFQLIKAEDGEIIQNLSSILGTAYTQYGSYLKLNEDGTFLDAIYPVTSGEVSTEGTYTVAKDYYRVGDCYVFLNYSDGRTKTFMRIYYEENVPVLSYFEEGETYQIDLKK